MYKFANALGTEHFVSEYCNEYNFKILDNYFPYYYFAIQYLMQKCYLRID
jgi:hypothetical protein